MTKKIVKIGQEVNNFRYFTTFFSLQNIFRLVSLHVGHFDLNGAIFVLGDARVH